MSKITIDLHDFKIEDGYEALKKLEEEFNSSFQKFDRPFFSLSGLEQEQMRQEMNRHAVFKYLTEALKIDEKIVAYMLYTPDLVVDYAGDVMRNMPKIKVGEDE